MKRYDEAIIACAKAVFLNPDYAQAYQNWGVSSVSKGNMQEAEKMFLKAIELKPEFLSPIYTCSVERWRHYEKYLAPLKEALKIS